VDMLWSASTTMRNPDRTLSFLQTAKEIEGVVWNEETQMKYQSLLIKNRFYMPTDEYLSAAQIAILHDYTHQMTYDEARDIFDSKHYVDPDMRGRTSFDPLEKLGLVALDVDESRAQIIRVTDFGNLFLTGAIDLGEMVFTSLLKMQFPNPLSRDRQDYNIKPFIGTLRLIRRVNELCTECEENAKGISKEEFGIFVLSLKSYRDIDNVAKKLLTFRYEKSRCTNDEERKSYVDSFISEYLVNFPNPHKNTREYTDNIIRYLRLTRYIYIRGGGYYVDLEPRRMVEINAILKQDDGAAKEFSPDEYKQYIGDYHAYELPFETLTQLREIAARVLEEINALSVELGVQHEIVSIADASESLRVQISDLREQRLLLQNLILRRDYQDAERIDEVIYALENIRTMGSKPSIALEKWINIALNVLNDAVKIQPNAPLGDDNEPTFTAPSGVPDIECYYDNFGAVCEVTMLTGRDQWYNEGQPVMRHLRSFEQVNCASENYCLFVAPRLHTDTINTFWNAVKYEYEGRSQKIVPITITSMIDILGTVRNVKAARKPFGKDDLRRLYDVCVDISDVPNSTAWTAHINDKIQEWSTELGA
jgi:AlwI restriction endonuclease.